jgi:hypothetical protein
MRVAAEVSWRLLLLAGMLWVVMKVISEVRLLVLAFAAALRMLPDRLRPAVLRAERPAPDETDEPFEPSQGDEDERTAHKGG